MTVMDIVIQLIFSVSWTVRTVRRPDAWCKAKKNDTMMLTSSIVFSCGAWKESDLASGWKDT